MSGTSTGYTGLKRNNNNTNISTTRRQQQHDPVTDFLALRTELELYDKKLLSKPAIILANKLDITRKYDGGRLHICICMYKN